MSRIIDIIFAAGILLLCLPLILLVALLITLVDGWPFWFFHERVGKDGHAFSLIKYRTMRVSPGAENGRFDAGDSGRVTVLGRVLRAAKIDELPQFINVLRGDMAIVGPRPEVRKWVDAYPERWSKILRVRPGITDPASIVFCREERLLANASDPVILYRDVILPEKLKLYEQYVSCRTILGDLAIICRTLTAVMRLGVKRA